MTSDQRPITIVRVSAEDWQQWSGVRLAALAGAPDAFGSTLAEWQDAPPDRWRARLTDVPFNVLAVVAGEPVGQASGTSVDADGRVELISMWVDPSARGTGAAAAIVEAVAGWAAERHATGFVLSVRRNNARAIAFYRRVGFVDADEPAEEPSEMVMIRSRR